MSTEAGLVWQDSDGAEQAIPRHEFSKANELHLFEFDDGGFSDVRCPDCEESFMAPNLGEALDWALGHTCMVNWAEAPAAAGESR